MKKLIETIEKYLLYIVLALFPVFVLSTYSAPFVIPKEVLLVGGAGLIIILWAVKIVIEGKLSFSVGKFDLGVALIAVSYLVSTFLATPNKMEAYLLPGTTTFVLGGAVLYFLINQFDQKTKKGGLTALLVSAVVLSLTSLLASLNAFNKIPQLPAFVKDASFNPMGGTIPSLILLAVTLIFSVGIAVYEKDSSRKIFFGACIAVIVFGFVALVGASLPGKATTPRFASMQDSWEVAVEALKKSPIVGAGPANYLTAFNVFRPVTYNASDLWQVRFTTGSNYFFTMITETGFVGLFAFAVLILSIYKYIRHNLSFGKTPDNVTQNLEKASIALLILFFFALPISPIIIVFLFSLLALVSKSENKILHLNVAATESNSLVSSRVPAMIVGIPFVIGVLAVFFFGSKVLAAEATFTKSLEALGRNDAKSTYDLMAAAINANPKVDRYHASFAQVNMALASSVASKKDITDSDRTSITQLVQQAISEGKATVALNPTRSSNWEVLAQIYRSVMPFAKGADQFAVQTYSQAIALDPTNPNLRIALGGVYYSLGNYDAAIDAYKLAVLAKPDLANAHYNLAIAYREKKDYDSAIAQMNAVLQIVPTSSTADYKVAKQTLDDLQSKKSAQKSAAGNGENLTAPQPAQQSNVKPPITLPQEANPPATPAPTP